MNPARAHISWLKLERYVLGELSGTQQREVEQELASCSLCQDCLAQIKAMEAALSLKPLPAVSPGNRPGRYRRYLWPSMGLAAAAAAAALLLILRPLWDSSTPPWQTQPGEGVRAEAPAGYRPSRVRIKGGELAIALVRNREGRIQHEPKTYRATDRFKMLVTCPQASTLHWEVVVLQPGEVSFPYTPRGVLACGNRVPLPGAFSLSGTGVAAVCLIASRQAVDRQKLLTQKQRAFPEAAVCTVLQPGSR